MGYKMLMKLNSSLEIHMCLAHSNVLIKDMGREMMGKSLQIVSTLTNEMIAPSRGLHLLSIYSKTSMYL